MNFLKSLLCFTILFGVTGCSSTTKENYQDNLLYSDINLSPQGWYDSENINEFADTYPKLYSTIMSNNYNYKAGLRGGEIPIFDYDNLRLDLIYIDKEYDTISAYYRANDDITLSYVFNLSTEDMSRIVVYVYNDSYREVAANSMLLMLEDYKELSDNDVGLISTVFSSPDPTNALVDDAGYFVDFSQKENYKTYAIVKI